MADGGFQARDADRPPTSAPRPAPRQRRHRRAALRGLAVGALMAVGAGGLHAAPPPPPAAEAPAAETAQAAQPTGLAASEVELAEGMLAIEEGRDLDAAELFRAAAAADPQNGTAQRCEGSLFRCASIPHLRNFIVVLVFRFVCLTNIRHSHRFCATESQFGC